MNFKEYVAAAIKLLEEKPEAGDYPVVFSADDEGNAYTPVYYTPSVGNYDAGEFYTENDCIEHGFTIDTVLIN